jgi:hypothetical protein
MYSNNNVGWTWTDILKQIKDIQTKLASDGEKCPFHAKITEATDLTIALANKILDTDTVFKPITGAQNAGPARD